MAIALVPIAIMPQIILAGVIAPLNGLGKLLARAVITVHWGKQALESLLPEPDLALLGLEQVEYGRELSVVSVHVAALAAATLLTLSLQDKAKGRL